MNIKLLFMQNISMNQILFYKSNNNNLNTNSSNTTKSLTQSLYSKKQGFVIILITSLFIFLAVIIYLFYSAYLEYKREHLYSSLSTEYNISKLYVNNNSISTKQIEETPIFTIIGIIKIDKIKISYPILSTINDELLKISPCKFSGPNTVNTIGNLCIAAHNYNDSRFFSNISKLNENDEIQLFDNNGKVMIYKVFDKYETPTNNTSCTSPQGNNTTEITLVTCNNLTGNRIIVKAKSITT